jgi:flagellar motor switch protein FliM
LPAAESAAIQIDIGILLPLIDLLLGGSGSATVEARELTEIEEQIVETLLVLICRELQLAWQAIVPVQFQVQKRLKQNQIPKLIAPEDKTLYLNFELVLNEIRGLVTIVFSSAITSRLLRLLGQDAPMPERGGSRAKDQRLRERMLDCQLTGELSIQRMALRVRELVELRPGAILTLPHAVGAPMSFSINGQALFAGAPVSCGASRGAVLQRTGSGEASAGEEIS